MAIPPYSRRAIPALARRWASAEPRRRAAGAHPPKVSRGHRDIRRGPTAQPRRPRLARPDDGFGNDLGGIPLVFRQAPADLIPAINHVAGGRPLCRSSRALCADSANILMRRRIIEKPREAAPSEGGRLHGSRWPGRRRWRPRAVLPPPAAA